MPAIWTSRQPWVRRPSGLVTLNRGSALARGLYAWWSPGSHGTIRDVIGGGTATRVGNLVSAVPTDAGWATACSGATGDYAQVPSPILGTEATISCWVRLRAATPSNGFLTGAPFRIQSASTTPYETAHYPWTDGNAYITTFRNARVDGITLSAAVNRAQWHLLTITSRPGTNGWVMYQNTQAVSTQTGLSAIYTETNTHLMRGGTDYYFDGWAFDWRIWSRAISAAEIRALYDPRTRWELYQPIVRRVVFDLAGGGGSSPQTLSGSAASATWTVPAGTWAQGSVALAGSAASAAWTVPSGTLTAGAVALSGAVATAAWTVPAGTLTVGAVALSGSAASAAWSVPAGALTAGSAALSGDPAVASWTVPSGSWSAGSGPQTLAGDAATATWAVPAGVFTVGAVALAGSPASAAWTVPGGALAITTALVGNPASATWALPAGALTAGAATLAGAAAVATWAVPAGTWDDGSVVAPSMTWLAPRIDRTWQAPPIPRTWTT